MAVVANQAVAFDKSRFRAFPVNMVWADVRSADEQAVLAGALNKITGDPG